ncbi:MAG: peptide-methionine (S)-S-oxide reductase [Mucilaginibacter sp.]
MIKRVTEEKIFDRSIVTEITPASIFYKAEDYHQNYFANNPGNPYCAAVIRPKPYKFAKAFTEKIKPELL